MAKISCPDCYDQGGPVGRCRHCRGDGFTTNFITNVSSGLTAGNISPKIPCDECSETGQCQTCGGTGYIKVEVEKPEYIERKIEVEEEYRPRQHTIVENSYVNTNRHKDTEDEVGWGGKIFVGLLVLFVAVWLLDAIVIPILLFDFAVVALAFALVIKKWRTPLYVLSIVGFFIGFIVFIFVEKSPHVIHRFSTFFEIITVLHWLNFIAGLSAAILLTSKLSANNSADSGKKNLIIVLCVVIVAAATVIWQPAYFGVGAKSNVMPAVPVNYNYKTEVKTGEVPPPQASPQSGDRYRTSDEVPPPTKENSTVSNGIDSNSTDEDDMQESNAVAAERSSTVYPFVEQMPAPDYNMDEYISKNLRYPIVAQESKIEGSVILKFIVYEDGSIHKIGVMKSLSPECDEEAKRVISLMPAWKAGRENGKPVKVLSSFPVVFRLQ